MMLTKADVRNIIVQTIRLELYPCQVRVNVREREDDDDVAFLVTVSIHSDCTPDNRRMLGLIRKIRAELDEKDVQGGFPFLSFITTNDELISGLEFA